ncbi:MAG: hypothetical protein GEV10_31935 [Streptosporangiales bacterium]|nr:hypothetical protein [Streptosporangiales bacterium]
MNAKLTIARSVVRLLAVVALAVSATVAVTTVQAGQAQAAVCSGWALADKYDHEAKVYGTGGLNSCASGTYVTRAEVVFYRDGVPIDSAGGDCRTRPCGFSTPAVGIPAGEHSWCADVLYDYLAPGGPKTARIVGNCIST